MLSAVDLVPFDTMSSPQSIVSNAYITSTRLLKRGTRQAYLQSGGMNSDGPRSVHSLGYGVDDDKVTEAMMMKREGGCESGWTSADDENSGLVRK